MFKKIRDCALFGLHSSAIN